MSASGLLQSVKNGWRRWRVSTEHLHCLSGHPEQKEDQQVLKKSEEELVFETDLPIPEREAQLSSTAVVGLNPMELKASQSSPSMVAKHAYMNITPCCASNSVQQTRSIYRNKPSLSLPNTGTYCNNNTQHRQYANLSKNGILVDDLSQIYVGIDYSSGEGRTMESCKYSRDHQSSREISYAKLDLSNNSSSTVKKSLSDDRLNNHSEHVGYAELDFPTMQALAQTAEETSLWQNHKNCFYGAPSGNKQVKRTSSLSRIKHSFSKPLRLLSKRTPSE